MKEKGVSQTALAALVGMTPQQTNNIVAGRVGVSMQRLGEIAAALGVPMWQMFVSPEEVAWGCEPPFAAFVYKDGEHLSFGSLEELGCYVDAERAGRRVE